MNIKHSVPFQWWCSEGASPGGGDRATRQHTRHRVSWSSAVYVVQGSSSLAPWSRSLSRGWILDLSYLFKKRKRTGRMKYTNMLPPLPGPEKKDPLLSSHLQHLLSSHRGQDILGLFHCLLFNAMILAKALVGHQRDRLGPALFNTFPCHVARGISGRFMTFVEDINSEAGKSREDNEVRQMSAKWQRKKATLYI